VRERLDLRQADQPTRAIRLEGRRNQLATPPANAYLRAMFKAFEFCIFTKATTIPTSPDLLHEVKYDGYRLRLEHDGTACG
jgi:ATP-dependent DNA ligase